MFYRSKVISLIVFLFILIYSTSNTYAFSLAPSSATSLPGYVRIFYYQEGKNARKSFTENLGSVDVLAPQTYSLNAAGELKGSVNSDIFKLAQKNNIKVMPLVTNNGFGQASIKAILNDSVKQERAIATLVLEAKKQGYWGWQVDFEQMDLSYRDAFSSFIKKLAASMKGEGLVLSVAVIAQVSENPNDYPKNLWQRIIGVYDYATLSSSADFISVMSYDDPESTGPVARYSWIEKVITHSLKYIPKEKLSLGIPLYYWKWDTARGKIVGIGGNTTLQETLKKYKVTKGYSEKEQVPFLTYQIAKKSYTIWYENAKSIEKKLELITKNDLHGFSAWALGLETPGIHSVVQGGVLQTASAASSLSLR